MLLTHFLVFVEDFYLRICDIINLHFENRRKKA